MGFKIVLIIVLGLMGINLLVLNYFWYLDFEDRKVSGLDTIEATEDVIYTLTTGLSRDSESTPTAIDTTFFKDQIHTATASLTKEVEMLKKNSITPAVSVRPLTNTSAPIREYYIPLGSSSITTTDWVDVPGIEAYVAPSNYGTLKEMYFEASLRIPSGAGQAFARVKNVTDNVSLIESEITHEGTMGKLLSSGKIPIPATTKLYRLQIKSSLGNQVVIDTSRLKLFAK